MSGRADEGGGKIRELHPGEVSKYADLLSADFAKLAAMVGKCVTKYAKVVLTRRPMSGGRWIS